MSAPDHPALLEMLWKELDADIKSYRATFSEWIAVKAEIAKTEQRLILLSDLLAVDGCIVTLPFVPKGKSHGRLYNAAYQAGRRSILKASE